MTGLDRVIRGGLLVSAVASFRADIAIAGGKVVAIGEDLSAPGAEVIDASGLLVMPGAIDVHTHFETGVGDMGSTADDYESGSRAAAAGGIIIDHLQHAVAVDGWIGLGGSLLLLLAAVAHHHLPRTASKGPPPR